MPSVHVINPLNFSFSISKYSTLSILKFLEKDIVIFENESFLLSVNKYELLSVNILINPSPTLEIIIFSFNIITNKNVAEHSSIGYFFKFLIFFSQF